MQRTSSAEVIWDTGHLGKFREAFRISSQLRAWDTHPRPWWSSLFSWSTSVVTIGSSGTMNAKSPLKIMKALYDRFTLIRRFVIRCFHGFQCDVQNQRTWGSASELIHVLSCMFRKHHTTGFLPSESWKPTRKKCLSIKSQHAWYLLQIPLPHRLATRIHGLFECCTVRSPKPKQSTG